MSSDSLPREEDEQRVDTASLGQPNLPPRVNADTVRDYIRNHPEIVAEDTELLGTIIPAIYSNDGVAYDMQRFAIDRLKAQNEELIRQRDRAMNSLRVNAAVNARMQTAVLAILESRNFEEMIRTVTSRLAGIIDVDRIQMCVEETHEGMIDNLTDAERLGVRIVPECGVDAMLGEGGNVLLEGDTRGPAMLFGPSGRDVKSFALVRLAISPIAPPGLLALGSNDPHTFEANQGTDLLEFLARVIERQVRAWLGLPEA
jgi:uncharacterized protein YigA (DUF484 family)